MLSSCLDIARFINTATYRRTPEWFSSNTILYEDKAIVLRKFDTGRTGVPLLIVPPQAGHHSSIADYDQDQSLVQTCLERSESPVYAIEWKPSTPSRRDESIDDLVRQLKICVNEVGRPVFLVGLCQGGWLCAIYTALYPKDVLALTLAAAPIDFTAGGGKVQEVVQKMPFNFYRTLVALGGGTIPGEYMLMGWKILNSYERFCSDYLNLWINVRDEGFVNRVKKFQTWYEYTQNISGKWYLQAVRKLFMRNQLIKGELMVLGKPVDLGVIDCPVAMLAGEKDDITLVPQLFNLRDHISTADEDMFQVVIPQAGHISVFMGRNSLKHSWPEALSFTLSRTGSSRKAVEAA
ncbi:MAG: alpha/beta fold hydrolase [Desulfomonilia bacterium]|nr:alpha/beta fold hydrolase [Desulfomonilia bacterium]